MEAVQLMIDYLDDAVKLLQNGIKLKSVANMLKRGITSYKEVNIHGNINSELDEVDFINQIIYEDKSAINLYMDNPDFPKTEEQWAIKQIYNKEKNKQ